jgi:hypothetical protein
LSHFPVTYEIDDFVLEGPTSKSTQYPVAITSLWSFSWWDVILGRDHMVF